MLRVRLLHEFLLTKRLLNCAWPVTSSVKKMPTLDLIDDDVQIKTEDEEVIKPNKVYKSPTPKKAKTKRSKRKRPPSDTPFLLPKVRKHVETAATVHVEILKKLPCRLYLQLIGADET
eukprot:UN03250